MIPPPEIAFGQIIFGDRIRSDYPGIPQLAQSILDNGLIFPLVLVPLGPRIGGDGQEYEGGFGLDAGGRRYHALKLLIENGDWNGTLTYASTSDPDKPGYLLKGDKFVSPFQRAMTEIAENLDRVDPDWRDQVKAIVKAYRLCVAEKHANGEEILMRDFGSMVGVEYTKLHAAIVIHDELILDPEFFKDCTSIRGAKTKLLKANTVAIIKLQAERSVQESPTLMPSPKVQVQDAPEPTKRFISIPITSSFINCNSLEYMAGLKASVFDHIVTDPDYAVSKERLGVSNVDAESGIHQENVELSLQDLKLFLELAFKVIKPQGFCVFWYDLDHHEKLQTHALGLGFAVQRWPLIWVKSDYRANAGPGFNFCKNTEYAMVCRKPNAVLAQVQMSSVFFCASADTVRKFNHPFAKPIDLSKWIYQAISIKGQTVYDPFFGSAALSIAALEYGLKPVGSEISLQHYSNGLLNMQTAYKKLIGGNVVFT